MNGLQIGDVTIPGRVLIAPMTGVSDLPFRQAASRQGAPYVATEMVACDSFARGRPDVVRRAAIGDGLPLMVIQLVGREAEWIAKGARLAEQAGRGHHRLQYGLPGQGSHRRAVGLGPDARRRTRIAADRRGGERHHAAGDLEDAAGLGRALEECARDRGAGRTIGRQSHHRAWPHPPAILQRQSRLARRRRRQTGGEDSRHRQWRRHGSGLRASGADAIGRRRHHDRARQLWPSLDRIRPGNRLGTQTSR